MGNERGCEAAKIFFSLIEPAKANKLNTYAYFRYIMTQLPLIAAAISQPCYLYCHIE